MLKEWRVAYLTAIPGTYRFKGAFRSLGPLFVRFCQPIGFRRLCPPAVSYETQLERRLRWRSKGTFAKAIQGDAQV